MNEKPTYELRGALRKDCMKDTATLEDFHALDSDWRELFRWLMSVSGDIPFINADGKEEGRLSSLWENHVLVVLVEIIRKDLSGYVSSFVGGQGTSLQKRYTRNLVNRCTQWSLRLDRFIRMSHGYSPDSPAMQVAVEIRDRLTAAMPTGNEDRNRARRMPAFMDNRTQPYFQMLGALQDIQAKAEEYISRIESGGDMDASLALLLTMVRNYSGIASDFNARLADWASFYRREILHDTPKEAVQDSTFITIEPDRTKTTGTFSLPEGTAFTAGKTADGSDLLYALDEKAYVVPATLSSVQSVFRKDDRLHTASLLLEGNRSARLFSHIGVTSSELEYGWMVTSRSLVLSEGKRCVTVALALAMKDGSAVPDLSGIVDGDTAAFRLQVSGEDGWAEMPYTPAFNKENHSLEFTFTLKEEDPAPVPCRAELHGTDTEYPAARLLFADRKQIDTLPEGLGISSVRIRTKVDGIRSFTLKGDLGDMDPGQPFYPFGPNGERGSRLVFGHPEAAMKNTVGVSLKGLWNKLPEKGFRETYRHYGTREAIGNGSFRIRCEWQDNGHWRECRDSDKSLFRETDRGNLCESASITINLDSDPDYKAAQNSKGLYRITLDAPETGFGVNDYYRLYAAAMMHNAKEKEKNHVPVPDMPSVPMLTEAVFGYESDETFSPGDGSGSRLLAVSATTGCEECACTGGGAMPLFVPRIAVPSLILGFSGMGDTSRLRLYMNLRYIMTGDMVRQGMDTAARHGRMAVSRHVHGTGWEEMAQEDILCEDTEELTRSGFIEVRCPASGPEGKYWLMLSFPDGNAPVDTAVDGVWLNCFRVTARNGNGNSLPVGTIAAPAVEDGRILSVLQPLPGYGGRPAEEPADTGIRSRIRISTRNRAVCQGDYESLVMEQFPGIEKVCCIPSESQDGTVEVVVFPKPEKRSFPLLPLWQLAEIWNRIRERTSPFVRTEVINAVYQPIEVGFKAVIREGVQDTGEVRRRLKRMVMIYFCSWFSDGTLPELGQRYSHEALLSRVGNDECITDVISLKVSGAEETELGGDRWYSPTARAGVLYVKGIRIELVDSRSGIEETRIGNDFVIG